MNHRFEAEPHLAHLTEFQRATVAHVNHRFYGSDPTRRFLVADETGLGKSLVARGVIATTIEKLQGDDSVGRIDIVYVCSNADIAEQNIRKLDVTGDPHLPFASRLTLLAKHSHQLATGSGRFAKPINLISFTPGTSFDMGWQTGKSEERAMLFLLLVDLLGLQGYRRSAALRILQGSVRNREVFAWTVDRLREALGKDCDEVVVENFRAAAVRSGTAQQFEIVVDELGRRRNLPDELRVRARRLTGALRSELARASVQTLEPDLVILDEFQRFRHLLDPAAGGEAAELAHHLFDYGDARVLLLSATPYKPFTYMEEAAEGEDHHQDFMKTLTFLAGHSSLSVADVASNLRSYRHATVTGAPVHGLAEELRAQLLRVMCRTERPQSGEAGMLAEFLTPAAEVEDSDLLGYVALRRLARTVGGQVTIDYWKSAPYFTNFMDGYQMGGKLREAVKDPASAAALPPILASAQLLNARTLQRFEPVDFANARLRQLARETVAAGWWQLLWMPPSLPYVAPEGPFAEPFTERMTKRLVFSSWAATPTAVASLLSYEAERRLAADSQLTENSADGRRAIARRLTYRMDEGRPASMTTLALSWPSPGLARLGDLWASRLLPRIGGSAQPRWKLPSRRGSRLPRAPAQRPRWAVVSQPTGAVWSPGPRARRTVSRMPAWRRSSPRWRAAPTAPKSTQKKIPLRT